MKIWAVQRAQITSDLLNMRDQLASRIGLDRGDFLVEGSDGIGRKARVPWARFASQKQSPSAAQGWYVVLLFAEDGHAAYLTLAHASTINDGGNFIDRPPEEAAQLVSWARENLPEAMDPRLVSHISLGPGRLARSYEATSVVAYPYEMGNVPTDEQLAEDLLSMASRLRKLYQAARLGQIPLSPSPEVVAAEAAAAEISSPLTRMQGFGLTAVERRAVELRAMTLATAHLRALGFTVRDVSASHSYDLVATRPGEELHIEVKGSTGSCGDILLTRNEVRHHLARFPQNGLIIVKHVVLNGPPEAIVASGGELTAVIPWDLDEARLTAISYQYKLS